MSETATSVSIFLAMSCWSVALVSAGRSAPIAWTAGLIFYLLHVFFAFDAFYEWSHHLAMETTARETAEVVGLESGLGLWVNYAFGVILALDAAQQWLGRKRHFSRTIDWLVIFMIVNGAVVFAEGLTRLYGVIVIVTVIVLRWRRWRKRSITVPESS